MISGESYFTMEDGCGKKKLRRFGEDYSRSKERRPERKGKTQVEKSDDGSKGGGYNHCGNWLGGAKVVGNDTNVTNRWSGPLLSRVNSKKKVTHSRRRGMKRGVRLRGPILLLQSKL